MELKSSVVGAHRKRNCCTLEMFCHYSIVGTTILRKYSRKLIICYTAYVAFWKVPHRYGLPKSMEILELLSKLSLSQIPSVSCNRTEDTTKDLCDSRPSFGLSCLLKKVENFSTFITPKGAVTAGLNYLFSVLISSLPTDDIHQIECDQGQQRPISRG